MEHEEAAELSRQLTRSVSERFGEERAAIDHDFIELMAQSLLRVRRLEIEQFEALDGEEEQ